MDAQTVPEELYGCWQRAWIEFADGTRDDTSFVVWLQLPSKMADIRIRPDRPALSLRSSVLDCTVEELTALADSESSSGFTRCTPIVVDDHGVRTATAEWFTRGYGVAFQPVSAFPEPGLLEWSDDGTVLMERAPSGDYTEEWRLIPGTRSPLSHEVRADGSEIYRAGDVAVLVVDRPTPIPRAARLQELIADRRSDQAQIAALVDCEFSFARRRGSEFVIEASTLPWREGGTIDVDLR